MPEVESSFAWMPDYCPGYHRAQVDGPTAAAARRLVVEFLPLVRFSCLIRATARKPRLRKIEGEATAPKKTGAPESNVGRTISGRAGGAVGRPGWPGMAARSAPPRLRGAHSCTVIAVDFESGRVVSVKTRRIPKSKALGFDLERHGGRQHDPQDAA